MDSWVPPLTMIFLNIKLEKFLAHNLTLKSQQLKYIRFSFWIWLKSFWWFYEAQRVENLKNALKSLRPWWSNLFFTSHSNELFFSQSKHVFVESIESYVVKSTRVLCEWHPLHMVCPVPSWLKKMVKMIIYNLRRGKRFCMLNNNFFDDLCLKCAAQTRKRWSQDKL
jgi:hypothetical protein